MNSNVLDELKLRNFNLEELKLKAILGLKEDIITYGNVKLTHMSEKGLMVQYGFTSEYISWGDFERVITNS